MGVSVDRKSRIKLLDRAIRATAEHLNQTISDEDVAILIERLSQRGRPPKVGYTLEQLARLRRVAQLLNEGEIRSASAAYELVATDDPGHSKEATIHWLRRHYPRYRDEQVGLFEAVAEEMNKQLELHIEQVKAAQRELDER